MARLGHEFWDVFAAEDRSEPADRWRQRPAPGVPPAPFSGVRASAVARSSDVSVATLEATGDAAAWAVAAMFAALVATGPAAAESVPPTVTAVPPAFAALVATVLAVPAAFAALVAADWAPVPTVATAPAAFVAAAWTVGADGTETEPSDEHAAATSVAPASSDASRARRESFDES